MYIQIYMWQKYNYIIQKWQNTYRFFIYHNVPKEVKDSLIVEIIHNLILLYKNDCEYRDNIFYFISLIIM